MIQHIDTWFAFARQYEPRIKMEEIILVTDCHRTRSWANFVCLADRIGAEAEFGVNAVHVPTVNIQWQFWQWRIRGARYNVGPEGENLPESQCVSFSGFRVMRLTHRMRLRAAADPSSDGDDDDDDDDDEHQNKVKKGVSLLGLLLKYIAKRAFGNDMVIVHDEDLARIDGFVDSLQETLQPDAVMNLLQRCQPEIHEVVYDRPSASANSLYSGMGAIKVAMLAKEIQEWTQPSEPRADSLPWSGPSAQHLFCRYPLFTPRNSPSTGIGHSAVHGTTHRPGDCHVSHEEAMGGHGNNMMELYQSNTSENCSGGTATSLNGPNPRLQLVSRTQSGPSKLAELGCFSFDLRI